VTIRQWIAAPLLLCTLTACERRPDASEAQQAHAATLVDNSVLIDTNILTPYRIALDTASVWEDTGWGEFDYPRAAAGGLDLAVLGILIPGSQPEPVELVDRLLTDWHDMIEEHPDRFTLITSPGQIVGPSTGGRVGVMLAVENGVAIGSELANLQQLYDRGVRLLTPVHSQSNGLGDSSYSQQRPWGGLSEFGRAAIVEMNRLGMIVDVSHMSDETAMQTLEASSAPVVASHSAARRYTLGWERNLSDELLEGIAASGGVVGVPFGGSFLWAQIQKNEQPVWDYVEDTLGLSISSRAGREASQRYRRENGIGYASVHDVAKQIDYIVDEIGIEHVALGSGFDGSGDAMPYGLKDVSQYSGLVAELIRRGYSDEDLRAIMGDNFLRVWRGVEEHATRSTQQQR